MDRRSRERFIESNNQIASLVEKFKLEGGAYRKYVGPPPEMDNMEAHQKIPLTAYGRPSTFSVLFTLIRYVRHRYIIKDSNLYQIVHFYHSRAWRRMSPFNWNGLKVFLLRLGLLPAFYFLLWIFYFHAFDKGLHVRLPHNLYDNRAYL